ncbi:MAG: hypothetical protein ACLTTO_03680 [Lachnospiraceae bacterium]
MVAKYYDKPKLKFEVMGTAEGEWYPGTPDEQVIKSSMKQKYDALDLEVDVNQIFDGKKACIRLHRQSDQFCKNGICI